MLFGYFLQNSNLEKKKHIELKCMLFSCKFVSDSLRLHGLQHAKLPCPSPSLGACSNSCVSEPIIAWYDNGYIWSLSLIGYWDIVWSILCIFYGMEFTTYFKYFHQKGFSIVAWFWSIFVFWSPPKDGSKQMVHRPRCRCPSSRWLLTPKVLLNVLLKNSVSYLDQISWALFKID